MDQVELDLKVLKGESKEQWTKLNLIWKFYWFPMALNKYEPPQPGQVGFCEISFWLRFGRILKSKSHNPRTTETFAPKSTDFNEYIFSEIIDFKSEKELFLSLYNNSFVTFVQMYQ